jgi:hypothetical protein
LFWNADETGLLAQNADGDGFFGTQIEEIEIIFKKKRSKNS